MPERMFKLNGNKYEVKNVETGQVHSKGTTKAKAEKQIRLLRAIEHGYKPGKRNV